MKTILTIRDRDFGIDVPGGQAPQERRAARAIVFDADKKVALLHVSKKHFHKLPGGGVEAGESVEEALRREVSEEIGCEIQNIRELGIVEEFRGKFSLHQLSHCFIADISGEKGIARLEPDEIEDGFGTVWMDPSQAIATLESEAPVKITKGSSSGSGISPSSLSLPPNPCKTVINRG